MKEISDRSDSVFETEGCMSGIHCVIEQCLEWHKLASSYKYVCTYVWSNIQVFPLSPASFYCITRNKYALYLPLSIRTKNSERYPL